MNTLADAFLQTLKDMYFAEIALTRALPEVAAATQNAEFRTLVLAHLAETEEQIANLEEIFDLLGEDPEGTKCDAIEGLIRETDGIIAEASGVALEACLVAAAQAVEHYEIARYGTLREWAKVLGYVEAHDLLSQNLDMEKAANSKLTGLAVTSVNTAYRAA